MKRVRDLIAHREAPLALSPEWNTRRAAQFLREHEIGGAPVLADERLVGFCSERDLVYRVVALGLDPDEVRVEQVMSSNVVTAVPDDTIQECEKRLREAHCRHLPVLRDGRLVACLSLRDFLQEDLRECRSEVQELTNYIQHSG